MDGGNDQQKLRRPIMQVTDESAKGDMIGDRLNRKRGFIGIWNVVKHFQYPCYTEDEHEEDRCSACAQRVTPTRLCGWNGRRVEVVKEGGGHGAKDKG